MDVYDEMAENYDFVYGDVLDLGFYLQEAKNARGSVLEIGCGNGRILLKLLEQGADAYGIDTSQKLLDILRERAKDQDVEGRIFKAGMLDFSLDRKFRLIIVPYRVFMHLKNSDEMKTALLNFKKHLADGGRLILHLYNPAKDELQMTGDYHHYDREENVSPDGKEYSLDWHLHYESAKSLAHYKIVLTLDEKKFTYMMDLLFVPMKEMESLLKDSGYKDVRAYCGFEYYPFSEDCREVLWVAEV